MNYNITYTPKKHKDDWSCPLTYHDRVNSPTMQWEPEDKPYFCAEVSGLDAISDMGRFPRLGLGALVTVLNKVTGNTILFRCVDVDRSDSGEDIAGWRFEAISGHSFDVTMLIIND